MLVHRKVSIVEDDVRFTHLSASNHDINDDHAQFGFFVFANRPFSKVR
jgi:hypothetical protein